MEEFFGDQMDFNLQNCSFSTPGVCLEDLDLADFKLLSEGHALKDDSFLAEAGQRGQSIWEVDASTSACFTHQDIQHLLPTEDAIFEPEPGARSLSAGSVVQGEPSNPLYQGEGLESFFSGKMLAGNSDFLETPGDLTQLLQPASSFANPAGRDLPWCTSNTLGEFDGGEAPLPVEGGLGPAAANKQVVSGGSVSGEGDSAVSAIVNVQTGLGEGTSDLIASAAKGTQGVLGGLSDAALLLQCILIAAQHEDQQAASGKSRNLLNEQRRSSFAEDRSCSVARGESLDDLISMSSGGSTQRLASYSRKRQRGLEELLQQAVVATNSRTAGHGPSSKGLRSNKEGMSGPGHGAVGVTAGRQADLGSPSSRPWLAENDDGEVAAEPANREPHTDKKVDQWDQRTLNPDWGHIKAALFSQSRSFSEPIRWESFLASTRFEPNAGISGPRIAGLSKMESPSTGSCHKGGINLQNLDVVLPKNVGSRGGVKRGRESLQERSEEVNLASLDIDFVLGESRRPRSTGSLRPSWTWAPSDLSA